jgi:diguanylate cyclase (GGDEF)-like protein
VLHDIGKLAVPEHIISKPGRLTPEEFEKMKIHPVVGAEILERVKFPYPVVPIVAAHHEKWDGTGYPHGLRGEQIPIGARILSAVDALDALASDRQYRRALPIHAAMARIAEDSGTAFDPKVIAFLQRRYVDLERKVRAQEEEPATKLSTDIRVERGAAPAAGFAKVKAPEPRPRRESTVTLLESIAAARRDVQCAFDLGAPDGHPLALSECLAVYAVRLKRRVDYDALAIFLLQDGVLVPEFVTGNDYRLFSSLRIPLGQGLSGWVAENRKALVNGNPSVEPGYLNDPNVFSTMRSALSVPLEGSHGIIGVLSLYRESRDAFTQNELLLLETSAPRLSLSIERAGGTEAPESEPEYDPVTGVPGPRSMVQHLDAELTRSKRLSTPASVIVCRTDGLRQLREALGQLEYIRALRAVASAIKEPCREFDSVFRTAPGEFVIIAPGLSSSAVETRVRRLSQITFTIANHALSVSAGAATMPDDGVTADDLIVTADKRLFGKRPIPAPVRMVAG